MMMGTADALPQAPVEKPVFVEDMTEQQLATAVCNICSLISALFLKKVWLIFDGSHF